MTPQFTLVAAIMGGGLLLTGSSHCIAAANAVPKFDVRPSCHSPSRRLVVVGHANGSETCIKREKEAHTVLIKNWPGYVTVDKTSCVGKVSHGGPPSYIELLSCFETREEVRRIREAHRKEPQG
jgi:hypothetical protein